MCLPFLTKSCTKPQTSVTRCARWRKKSAGLLTLMTGRRRGIDLKQNSFIECAVSPIDQLLKLSFTCRCSMKPENWKVKTENAANRHCYHNDETKISRQRCWLKTKKITLTQMSCAPSLHARNYKY